MPATAGFRAARRGTAAKAPSGAHLTGMAPLFYKNPSHPRCLRAWPRFQRNAPLLDDPWRFRFTLLVAAAMLLLLVAGGLVTSTGSGLAVPDWPLSFGRLLPPMVGGVLFEHGHRLIAGAVGLLTLILAVVTERREPRRAVRRLARAALGAEVLQGLLGGLTVLLRLPPVVSAAHACLAQACFAMVVALLVVTARSWIASTPADPRAGRSPFGPLAVAAGAVYLQLALGAILRHTGAGLAIPDFPLAFGRLVPPFDSFDVAAHFAHRVFAVVVLALVGYAALRAGRDRSRGDVAVPARMAATLTLLQLFLGGAAVLSRLAVVPTTAHVVNAALILAALVIAALRSRRAPLPAGVALPVAAARGSAA